MHRFGLGEGGASAVAAIDGRRGNGGGGARRATTLNQSLVWRHTHKFYRKTKKLFFIIWFIYDK